MTITTTEPGQTVSVDAFAVLDVAGDATLVGAGDIASCTRTQDEATAALAASVDGIVFTIGDNVYPDGSPTNFANCYGPSWGALKSRTRPVIGNHEYSNNPGAAGYFGYFGAAAGPAGRLDLIQMTLFVKGDLDAEQLQRLHEIANRCPVHRTLEARPKIVSEVVRVE